MHAACSRDDPKVKRSKKWNCKVCDEKQSILKVWGQGSGSDCRRHVQKLNLLQGEVDQAPVNMLGRIEEPVEGDDENTVVKLEENVGWQEEKEELISRWAKYLDKSCDESVKKEEEEEMVHIEKQMYPFKRNIVKDSKKRKTSLCLIDAREAEEKGVAGFAKCDTNFENRRYSATVSIKSCGDAKCKSTVSLDAEELLVPGKNKEPGSRVPVLSKWEKFLSSAENHDSSLTATAEEKTTTPNTCRTPLQVSAATTTSLISVASCNCHALKQNASILPDGDLMHSNSELGRVQNIPTDSSALASTLPQTRLMQRVPEELASDLSANPLAGSNTKGLYRSIFSTEDDFDAYL
ncbi:MRN complex-interacting protein isoform X2 [Hemicordylus capensis]|uniref:MRN complex-interacting protein isoform X2 n=1 Tax=Hemicordylus capensis TaxID=884348 RepID=UPI0023039C29|nr:MRN complex-interacting protein isoform X2 [Hemicordylus capensis]